MPIRFTPRTALSLTLAALVCATHAHADDSYQPYYYTGRDSIQYANATPPQYEGVQQQVQPAAGQITNWQSPQVTLHENPPVPVSSQWDSHSALYHFNNDVWVSTGTSFLNYKETIRPIADSDRGWMPSLAAGADYMNDDQLYLSLNGAVSFGDAHYNGAVVNINTLQETPYQQTNRETISTVDGKIGRGFYLESNTMLIPYVDVGYRYWKRDTGGFGIEDYHNFETLGGLMMQVTPTRNVLVSLYGAGGSTVAADMKTGPSTLKIGDAGIYKVGGKIGIDLTKRLELFTTVDFDHFHFAQSPVNVDIQEPGSRTNETTMRVGFAYLLR